MARLSLIKLCSPTYAVFAADVRHLLNSPPIVQSAYLGDDAVERQRKIDSLAVFLAAYDYAVATVRRRLANVAQLPPQPKIPLLAEPADDDAPSIELVLELRFYAYSLDIDSLDEMDAVDLQKERDWCDYWYAWYSSQLDAS